MENKKSGIWLGFLIGFLVAIIACLSIYIVLDKKDNDKKDDKKDTQETIKDDKKDENKDDKKDEVKDLSDQTFDLANFDETKIINKNDKIKYHAESVKEAAYSYDSVHPEIMVSTNQDVKVRVNWNDLCYLGKESKDYPYAINLDKDIRVVYVAGWGQTNGNSYLFYLMKDGTVEYTPLICETAAEEAISSDSYKLNSKGVVPGVSDIVMIAQIPATPSNSPAGGWFTAIAIKADGSFYDLAEILGY